MLVIFLISMCVVAYAIYNPDLDQIKELYRDVSRLWQTSGVERQAVPAEPSGVRSSTELQFESVPGIERGPRDASGLDVLVTAVEKPDAELPVGDTADNGSHEVSTIPTESGENSATMINDQPEYLESSLESSPILPASLSAEVDIEPEAETAPDPLRLPDLGPVLIDFAFDSTDLASEAQKALDTMVAQLRRYRAYSAAIRGYSDSQGEKIYNLELSRRRAVVVAEYLVRGGIDAGRLSVEGKGVEYDEEKYSNSPTGSVGRERRVVRIALHRTTASL